MFFFVKGFYFQFVWGFPIIRVIFQTPFVMIVPHKLNCAAAAMARTHRILNGPLCVQWVPIPKMLWADIAHP